MTDDAGRLRNIDYRAALPWTNLFRGFRIAVDFRKVLVAALGLLVLILGNLLIEKLPFSRAGAAADVGAGVPTDLPEARHTLAVLLIGPAALGEFASRLGAQFETITRPWLMFVNRGAAIIEPADWPAAAYAWTRLLWLLIVTALFGGAVSRMAAVQFARDEKLGLVPALRFAAVRFSSFLTAPLLPLLGIGLLWALCALIGLAGRIPAAGPPTLGALWIIPAALGFVITLVLFGVAAGWPLMYATIATEDSDAFDGFSRSYSYVFGRPWQYLWNALVAVLYGGLLMLFVAAVAISVLWLSATAVRTGFGEENTAALMAGLPRLLGENSFPPAEPTGSLGIGAMLAGGWLSVIGLLVSGFAYSYFWTAATIIYFLLRKADDGTDLDEVQLTGDADEDDLLPLVGVAASQQPVVERPPGSDTTPPGETRTAPPGDAAPTGRAEPEVRDVPSGE